MTAAAAFACTRHEAFAGALLRSLARFDDVPVRPLRASDSVPAFAGTLAPRRLRVCPGDSLFRAGGRCSTLYVLNSGIFRTHGDMSTCVGGRYRFRGDWLGLDGVSSGRHPTSAVALDSGEVWALRLDALLVASAVQPMLMSHLRAAMGVERERNARARNLEADAAPELRVADFLLDWALSLQRDRGRGVRPGLRVACAEVAGYLALPADPVGQAFSCLEAAGALRRVGAGGREALVDEPDGLARFLERHGALGTLQ